VRLEKLSATEGRAATRVGALPLYF
jgi:hypothetical protein